MDKDVSYCQMKYEATVEYGTPHTHVASPVPHWCFVLLRAGETFLKVTLLAGVLYSVCTALPSTLPGVVLGISFPLS